MKAFCKKLTAKLRTKSFWVTLAGAISLIASQAEFGIAAAEKIMEAVGGILVLLGLATSPAAETKTDVAAPNHTDAAQPSAFVEEKQDNTYTPQ